MLALQLIILIYSFLYVISEETDHVGMYAANDLNISPEFLVVGL